MAALAEPLDIMKLVSLRPEFGTLVARGHVLYSAGDPADEMYVVMSGRVQVERPSTGDEVVEPGGLVGEVDLFADEPRAGSAKALSDCSLLAFDRQSVGKLAQVTPTFALLAIRNACQRVVRLEHMLTDAPFEPAPGAAVDAGTTEHAAAVSQAAVSADQVEPGVTERGQRPTEPKRDAAEERTAPTRRRRANAPTAMSGPAAERRTPRGGVDGETAASETASSERSGQQPNESAAAASTTGGPSPAVSALVGPGATDRSHPSKVEPGATPSSERRAPGGTSTGPSPAVSSSQPASEEAVQPLTIGPVLEVDYLSALGHKEQRCPNCHVTFQAWIVRPEAATVQSRDLDFMNHYQGVDPTWYAVWVCPSCQFAAYAEDFSTIQPFQLTRVRPRLDYIRSSDSRIYDFSRYRNADLALRSFQLAVARYADEDAAADRIAGLFHRMGWIERARGNRTEERHWLQTARQYYERAFRVQDSSQMGLVWSYLIAELDVRLGDYVNALRWFDTASKLPHFRQQSTLDKMLRDRQQEIAQLIRSRGIRTDQSAPA